MTDAQLFSDGFQITSVIKDKYDRCSRLWANSLDSTLSMTLDFNQDLYPLAIGETFSLVLATTLNLDGTKDDVKGWREPKPNERNLADDFDYVMHGKVYRFDEGDDDDIKVYLSFGGLLLYLEGPYKKLTPLRTEYVYLLMKK